jgi:tyrosinase
MRLRKNVKDLSLAEKQAFVNAVLALKQQPSVLHPQDATLSRYDDYPEVHMNAMMAQQGLPNAQNFHPGWAHNAPAFFPWHRVMILAFENDLASVDPSVTLPYWDWTDPASSPFTPDFLGTNGDPTQDHKVTDGPFAFDGANHWTLKATDNPGDPAYLQRDFGDAQNQAIALPTGPQVASVVNPQTPIPYENAPYHGSDQSFRSDCEYQLHNLVHRWVGGTMLAMTSPNDPVFFLHHCNIDRLWWMWQSVHPGSSPYLPVTGAAAGHNLNDSLIFALGGFAPFPGTFTPASVIDNLALGYTYEPWNLRRQVSALAAVRVLFGIINDAPGVWIDGQGHIHHGGGGPGDPALSRLAPRVRDDLLGLALTELAGLASQPRLQTEIRTAITGALNKVRG